MNPPSSASVFSCKICGECCRGRGGVRLNEKEAADAAEYLSISVDELKKRYLEPSLPPWDIKCGSDGFCIFSLADGTCRIHLVKPAVCRSWPFLPGPIKFESAFLDAKESCPGLRPDLSWQEFLAEANVNPESGKA